MGCGYGYGGGNVNDAIHVTEVAGFTLEADYQDEPGGGFIGLVRTKLCGADDGSRVFLATAQGGRADVFATAEEALEEATDRMWVMATMFKMSLEASGWDGHTPVRPAPLAR